MGARGILDWIADISDFQGCVPERKRMPERKQSVKEKRIVRGFTETKLEPEQLAHMVAEVMKTLSWGKDIDISTIEVEDKSGFGGSKTFKVSAPGCIPPTVALHSRSDDVVSDPLSEPRMEAAAELFAANGLAPRRIAQGGNWFVEEWEGTGQPTIDSLEKYAELGRLVAKIHTLPTEWYDEWRAKLQKAHPFLEDVPVGSHVWLYAGRPESTLGRMDESCRKKFVGDFFAPVSPAAQRIVTTHGDLHAGNMIETKDGLKCLDFEFTSVTNAVQDLGYICAWTGRAWWEEKAPEDKAERAEKKRVFLRAYLESMGDPSGPEEVEDLLVDAEVSWLGYHFSPCAPWGTQTDDKKLLALWTKKLDRCVDVVKRIREQELVRQELLTYGFDHFLDEIVDVKRDESSEAALRKIVRAAFGKMKFRWARTFVR